LILFIYLLILFVIKAKEPTHLSPIFDARTTFL